MFNFESLLYVLPATATEVFYWASTDYLASKQISFQLLLILLTLFSLWLFYGQVDSVEKIEKLLKGKATELENGDLTQWQGADYNCLLIEVMTDSYSDNLHM